MATDRPVRVHGEQGDEMEIEILVLEYFRVLLTAPPLLSIVAVIFIFTFAEDIKALLLRVAKIRLPGGAEFDTQQGRSVVHEEPTPPLEIGRIPVQGIPPGLAPAQEQAIAQLIRAHIATAYLWEYRYLNYFLARGTQLALDWFVRLPQPTTYNHYDSFFLPIVPSARERQAMVNALEAHHLIDDGGPNIISVTSKGREYHQWRGALPPPTNTSTGPS